MKQIIPVVRAFTLLDEDTNAVQLNSLYLIHNENHYQFPGGAGDTIFAFTERLAMYVLTINNETSTVGLNAFMVPEPDPINSIYLHKTKDIEGALGRGWRELSPVVVVEQLMDLLI